VRGRPSLSRKMGPDLPLEMGAVSYEGGTLLALAFCMRIERAAREKEEVEMSYYPDFDPHFIRGRNEGLRREVSTYRLEKRLRQNRELRSGRLVDFVSRSTLPLLRMAGLAG
jgi:hypothetical protein